MHAMRLIVSSMLSALLAPPLALGLACDRGAPDAGPPGSSAAAPASAAALDLGIDPAGPAYADEDLAVPSDFEAEAEREITPESYRAELEVMERELDASVPAADAGAATADGGAASRRPAGADGGTKGARVGSQR
jgi:hypothetical protein